MANKKDLLSEKGLFERLVRVETKIDMASEKDKKTNIKFSWFVFIIVGFEVINLYFNYLIMAKYNNIDSLIQSIFK